MPKNEYIGLIGTPVFDAIPIEKEAVNIWFSVNNERPAKYVVDKFGFYSLSMLASFREKGLITLVYDDDITKHLL